jgi:D-glycero-D-manno-heptose 1,7-bisphosphate phosphatase
MNRGVFLDRDGVINKSILINGIPKPPKSLEELLIIDGVPLAISLLKQHGFIPVVITNQPDVARGTATVEQIKAINSEICKLTDLEFLYMCVHDDDDECICRKPKTGLIIKSATELNIDLSKSFLVGDRWRDVAAGNAAGLASYFIDYSYSEKAPKMPFTKVGSLLEAVQLIIGDIDDS